MAKKNSRSKYNPSSEKQIRVASANQQNVNNTLIHNPVWQLKNIDLDHEEWGWKNLRDNLEEVLSKLQDYESMQWKEIKANNARDHSVDIDKLDVKAKKRLQELKLDDVDQLYRLRLNALKRVWGILEGYVFKILWWDPEHTVCPSNKKHT